MKHRVAPSAAAAALILLWPSGFAWASTDAQSGGLQAFDWVIIGLYALATIGLGVYFSLRQRSTEEYFVGSGNMSPTLIGVSTFATLLSTISYLSMPGEAAGKGPMLLASLLALPFIYVIVGFILLPVYMRRRVTSAYELLEDRLGLSIRLLGTCMFLALRLVWMTLLMYLAAKALTVMMGISPTSIPWIVLATGMVSVIYTSLGGLRAVVITDVMQTVLLFGGAVLVIITVSMNMGGFDWFPTTWDAGWDRQPLFSFDPKTRVTLVGTVLMIICWHVCTAGGDQTAVQRYMATRDARAARRALGTQLCVGAVVTVTLLLVGLALLGYLRAGNFPGMAADMAPKDAADDLFPQYIAFHLPVGVSGLVVAAMFAAAMSSVDSGVNSVTAVVMTDFLERFNLAPKSQKGHVRIAQVLALAIGVVVVLGSSYAGYVPGNITQVTNTTVNLLVAPIFGLFFFALFVPRSGPLAVWIATLASVAVAAAIAFCGPLVYFLHVKFGVDPTDFNVQIITETNPATGVEFQTCESPISFQYMGPAALLTTILVGTILSYIFPRRQSAHGSVRT